jgi:exonuclease VII large subunit
MKSSKRRSAVIAVAFLALAAIVVWQQLRARRLMAEAAALRDQLEQAATLREENERLARQLQAATERSQADLSELVRLRGQAGRTRQIEQENAQLKNERERLAKQLAQSSASETNEPETPEQKLLAAKSRFGCNLGMALIMVADENEGCLPTDLRGALVDTVERLSSDGEHNIQAKQFELVYRGSLHEVKDGEETILAREKEPVQRSDGQWVRLYVMADGSSRYIAAGARDGFAAREKEFWPGQFKP